MLVFSPLYGRQERDHISLGIKQGNKTAPLSSECSDRENSERGGGEVEANI